MKKGLGIVFMLTLVVLLSSVAVFFVEATTTPIIEARQQAEIEEALKEVYPAIEGSGFTVKESTLDFSGSPITGAQEILDGTVLQAIVYTVQFRGYASDITYVVGVDREGLITGYKTISQADTAGFGAQIGDAVNWEQFTDMMLETAGAGGFDGLAGATFTTNYWKDSFASLYAYHDDNDVFPALSEEDKLNIQLISFAGEYTYTALTPTNPVKTLETYDISAAYVGNDGTDDKVVVYYKSFFGFAGDNNVMIAFDLETEKVLKFQAISSDDTDGYGAMILEADRWTQFADMVSVDLLDADNIDGISGATFTTDAWKTALAEVSIFHQAEFEDNIVYTIAELDVIYKEQLTVEDAELVDVTEQKIQNLYISNIFDAKNDLGDILGTVYYVSTLGEYRGTPTVIQFLVGVNPSGEFTGLRVLDTTDALLAASSLVVTNPNVFDSTGYFGEEIEGIAVDGVFALDTVVGFEGTVTLLQGALEEVARYHDEDYPRRDDYEAEQTDLEAAFTGATTFTSLYENYNFVNGILNVYEAKDDLDALLGYVYVGKYTGNNSDILYSIGVDTSGVTQQIHIIEGAESWGAAYEYDYSQGGFFQTSPWLDNFEDISYTAYIADPVDGISGVSTTTGGLNNRFGLIESVLKIFEFHDDNSTGGALE